MGQTAVEKILSRACGHTVTPGEIIIAHPDLTWIPSGFGVLAAQAMEELGVKKVAHPEKAITYLIEPSFSKHIGESDFFLAQWSEVQGIRVIRGGVPTALLARRGYIKPGQLIVGPDSHSPTLGALGCISISAGDTELGVILATGAVWMKVPKTIVFHLTGSLPRMCSAKDIMLGILKDYGVDVAVYKVVEFTGPSVERMDIWSRLTLCNMTVESGAMTGFIVPDENIIAQLAPIKIDQYEIVRSDEDASYEYVYEINVNGVTPLIACPDSMANITEVSSIEETPITHAFLGSCTNGWIDDLRTAAQILSGKKVAKNVRMIVAPADDQTMLEAESEGLISIFLKAGALVTHPHCSMCSDIQNHMGPGEVCISSSGRNFKARMGHPDSKIYVTSPATVAASAVLGYIADPRNFQEV